VGAISNKSSNKNKMVVKGEEKDLEESDGVWLNYSQMDKATYTSLLTGFSLLSSLATHPLNVITTRQQALPPGDVKREGMHEVLQKTWSTLGWRGLFRGWMPIAIMGIPSQVIYFTITESSREYMQVALPSFLPSIGPSRIDLIQATLSSVVANAVSLVPYVPAELISCRLMVQEREGLGMVAMTKKVWKEEGAAGLFRGFNASLAVGVFFSAQWWWTYSVCRREGSKVQLLNQNPFLLDAVAGLFSGVFSTSVAHPLDTVRIKLSMYTNAHTRSRTK